MTSLAYIFTMETGLFCHNFFYLSTWHFLRLLGCKRKIRSHFAGVVSEQVDMKKGSFQRWCKESRPRYRVSIYRTSGFLLLLQNRDCLYSLELFQCLSEADLTCTHNLCFKQK